MLLLFSEELASRQPGHWPLIVLHPTLEHVTVPQI